MPVTSEENLLNAGLVRDVNPQYQPDNTYVDAENLVLSAGMLLVQERAPALLAEQPPYPVVGMCALGKQEIVFCTDGTTSEVGFLEGTTYNTVLTSELLSWGSTISCTARIDYRGHRLVYFANATNLGWLDLDDPTTDLPNGLSLLPAPQLPSISVLAVGDAGDLPTGLYQASVCLLSASKNPITYSLFTNGAPIVNELLTIETRLIDGAPPQTAASGSITFHLDNLPAEYPYAQLIIATYAGSSNQLTLHRLPLIPLLGRSSLDYTFYSLEQLTDTVELEEILVGLADYVAAEVVIQKDGRLLLGGVQTAEPAPVDWQAIANNIVLEPAYQELTHLEFGTAESDYKYPLATVNAKGFMRNEVYSFSFTPVVSGRRLDAYHIPGRAPQVGDTPADLGFAPYYSEEEYPLVGGYPTGFIRHHRMPRMDEAPIVTSGTESGAAVHVLGLQEKVAPDFSGLPADLLAKLDGYIIGMQPRTETNKSILGQGIAQPLVPTGEGNLMVSPFNGKWPAIQEGLVSDFLPKGNGTYAAFYSPETQILGNDSTGAVTLEIEAKLRGYTQLVANHREGGRPEKYAHTFMNLYEVVDKPADLAPIPLANTDYTRIYPADDYGADVLDNVTTIYTWQQNGYTLLGTEEIDGFYRGETFMYPDVVYHEISDATDEVLLRQTDGAMAHQDDAGYFGVASRFLYNLYKPQARQYGLLEQATYHPLAFRRLGDALAPIFGGDTFITRVALQSSTAERLNLVEHGILFRTLNYFWCESTVNNAYRHYRAQTDTEQGTLPYYPKRNLFWLDNGTGVMQYPTGLGHPTGYNRQYSFTNTIIPLFPKDGTIATVTTFPNRVAYSEQAVEGEQLDVYRMFLENSYHDVPKDKGPITNLWTWQGTLFIHCAQTLYRAFFNEATTQTTSIGEVYLGNGGLFPRPSVPVLNVEGGFAGTRHRQASVTTPAGHFFVDVEGQRIYLFNQGLNELTKAGMREHFQETLAEEDTLTATYDYREERYLLFPGTGRAVSHSLRNSKWTSFHAYASSFSFSTQSRALVQLPEGLATVGEGELQDCYVTAIANNGPAIGKRYDGVSIHADNWPSSLQQQTANQDTDILPVVAQVEYGQSALETEVLMREVNNAYQAPIGRDQNTGDRLRGAWLRHTTRWLAAAVPTTIRLLSVRFTQNFR